MRKKQRKRRRKERCSNSRTLSTETTPQYFYMPITQAAKEPNMELAPLKKRYRERGVRPWPHRKLMSLHVSHACDRVDGADGRKPYFWRTKNLMRPIPASDFDWKRQRYHPHLVKTEDYLESVSPLSRPHHRESQKDLVPLWRVWFLHPHPCPKHIALGVDSAGYGDCDCG